MSTASTLSRKNEYLLNTCHVLGIGNWVQRTEMGETGDQVISEVQLHPGGIRISFPALPPCSA